MTSAKRAEANRRNAQRSTGPKSPAGRSRASLNAIKHSLTARTVLLPFEDAKAYGRAARLIFDQYRPFDAIEECLVELIVAARWRLVRIARAEDELVISVLGRRFYGERPSETRRNGAQVQLQKIFGDNFVRPASDECVAETNNVSPEGWAQKVRGDGRRSAAGTPPTALRRIRKCLDDQDMLLNAYVSPVTPAPMNEIARQRRQATRELMRNIAALEVLQRRRKWTSEGQA